MNQAAAVSGGSGDGRKVRFVQLNDRMFAVHGGASSSSALRWTTSSSSLSDEQKMNNDEQHHSIRSHESQQQQQQLQVSELASTGRQVATSLQVSSTSAGSVGDGGHLATGYSNSGQHSMSTAAAASSSMTSVSDLVGHASWSSGQSASVQHMGGACEAATVAQQMIYRHEVSSEQHAGDKLEFEDGLRHLRSLYQTQLNASTRSVNMMSVNHYHYHYHHHILLWTSAGQINYTENVMPTEHYILCPILLWN